MRLGCPGLEVAAKYEELTLNVSMKLVEYVRMPRTDVVCEDGASSQNGVPIFRSIDVLAYIIKGRRALSPELGSEKIGQLAGACGLEISYSVCE
jgi:hypothetical protein